MQLHSVTTTGSALAACLRTVATSGQGFGFLIGRVISRTSKVLQDAAGELVTQQPQAVITAYICCPPGVPATSIAGEPEGGLLQAVQQQLHTDTVLGWFAYRSLASLQPSVQEEAISSSMAAACNRLWGQRDAAVLFALVSVQQRHDAASYDFEQRMLQLNSSSHKLEPIDVHIRCVGQAGSLSQRYQPVVPFPMLARVPSFTHKTTSNVSQHAKETSHSGVEVSSSMLRSVAYTGLKTQIEAVESVYRKTVRQLEQMAHQACIESAP